MNRSTKLVISFSALSSFSEAALSLYRQLSGGVSVASSNAHRKNNHQALRSTGLQTSSINHSELSTLSPGTMSNFRSLLAILFLTVSFAPIANAADYYVATNGSDTNPGTLSSPWKTITKAANTLVAGDSVNIRAGTYKEQVTPKNSGYAGAFITYAAYPGEKVTVDGSNGLNRAWTGIFDLTNRSYLQISGLRIINSPGFGVFMSGSRNIKILNNYTYHTNSSGIWTENGDTITVDGNEIEGASASGDQQESLSIEGTNNFIVSNNRVHGGGREGIDAKEGSSNGKIFGNTVYNMARVGIYVDAYGIDIDNVEVYNNTVYNSKPTASGAAEDGIRIGAERGKAVSNVKIYGNVIYNISGSGIVLSKWTDPGYPEPKYSNISLYNNTVYNAGTKAGNSWGGGGIEIGGSSNTGIVIRNNILSKAGSFNIAASSGVAISNNLFDGGSTSGTNAVTGNPLFRSIANADFRLQATSPAISAGTSTGAPSIDFDLKARPQGGQVDIGAFENGSSTTPPLTISDTTPPSAPQNLAATPTNSSTVNLSWSQSTDNVGVAGYKVYRDNTEIGTSAVPSFTDTSVVKGTTYNYTIKAYDSAGNLSVSSKTANVQTLQQAINISSYYVNNITSSGATINWTTNAPSSGSIYYGTRVANLNSSAIFSGLSTKHSVNLTGLIRRTSYYYQIIAKDSVGATVTSTVFNFKTARR